MTPTVRAWVLHQIAKKFPPTGRIRHFVDRTWGPSIAVLLSFASMAQALNVWRWRPGDPVDLSGDSVAELAQIKDMLDHGEYGSNHDLGAPFHQDASWFPHADHLHLFLTGKVIALFSDNPFTVSAIYFFLGFPLAALSMYWLARQRRVGRLGSVVAGVLFSVLPGHQLMFQHLWLASYWVVPLGISLVLRAAMGEPLFRIKVDWRDRVQRRSAGALNLGTALCVLCISIGGIYYSAFTLLLLATILGLHLVATRDRAAVVRTGLLFAAISALSFAAAVSVSSGQDKSTLVSMSGQRGFWESEQAAGKLMDLILPWIHHRVGALQNLTVVYNGRTTPTLEETALGVIALVGVVSLMVMMLSALVPHRVKPVQAQLGALGTLTLVALSLYSIGGLGSFIAFFATPQIRTWSRLFVFIGLFGLLAVGHWVSLMSRRSRAVGLLTAVALLTIGVLDQTNPAVAPRYKNLRNEVGDLTSFSQNIEARVGPLCSVFQLPVVPFPENPPVHAMGDYAQLRPYLTSSSLRWSYGAFKGTTLSDWQLALPMTSTSSLVDDIVAAGFCAVEVDRAGFPDRAARLDGELTGMLGTPISSTRDGRLLAWDLSRAHAALTSRISVAEVAAMADHVLHPLVVYSDHGTYEVEHDNSIPFQWTGPSPEIDVYNFGRTAIDSVHLTFSLAAPDSAPRRFSVHLPNGSTQVVDVAGRGARQLRIVVDAAPGPNVLTITTAGQSATIGKTLFPTSADSRIVYGKLIDLQARVAEPMIQLAVVQQRVG